jgi:threonine dehydratase
MVRDGRRHALLARKTPRTVTAGTRRARLASGGVVTLADIRATAERIRPFVVRTPLERSMLLSDIAGTDVWLKFECFQLTGSFKLRGALNALSQLGQPRVITASAGNHGLGVARAAALLGAHATVVVPETASAAKVDALRRSGADLVQVGQTYDDAEGAGIQLARDRGLPFISAYNDPAVVAGGGTIALEIFEDAPDVKMLVVPAGGGGLIGGIGVAAHGLDPDIRVYGVQSEASPALHAAFAHGARVTVDVHDSLADGLAGNVEPGSITLSLLTEHVHEVLLVTEAEIADAMRWLLHHEHALVEGSGAVGVATLLQRKPEAARGPIGVILTGRNVAASTLSKVLLAEL